MTNIPAVKKLAGAVVSVRKAAEIVGVTRQSVRMRYRTGKLAGDESFGVILIDRAGLETWKTERAERARLLDF